MARWSRWAETDPLASDLKKKMAGFYETYHRERDRQIDEWMRTTYWPLFAGRILEVGSGTRLPQWNPSEQSRLQYVALDISRQAVSRARALTSLVGVVGDGESLPFADRSFDWVACYDVLEHVPDPGALITEMCRVSRDHLAFAGPNYVGTRYAPGLDRHMPWTLLRFLVGAARRWYRLPHPHLRYDVDWEPDSDAVSGVNACWVAREVARHGFRIGRVETWGRRYPVLDRVPAVKYIGFFMFLTAQRQCDDASGSF